MDKILNQEHSFDEYIEIEKERWKVEEASMTDVQKFYDHHPSLTTPFVRTDILETISEAFGRELFYLKIKNEDKIHGIAGLVLHKRGPWFVANRLPIRYSGIVAKPEKLPNKLKLLHNFLLRRRIVMAYYSFPPQLSKKDHTFEDAEFDVEYEQSYLLPINGATVDEILEITQPRMRSSVRKALNQLTISDSTEDEVKNDLYELMLKTYRRKDPQSMEPYPPSIGSVIRNKFRAGDAYDPTFHIRTARLKDNNEIAGMMIAISHPATRKTYSWMIARRTDLGNLQVSGALIADMAAVAAGMGSEGLGLGGGTKGIKKFKQRMGGQPTEYLNVRVSTKGFKILQSIHETILNLVSYINITAYSKVLLFPLIAFSQW